MLPLRDYRRLLGRIERWHALCVSSHPERVPCRRGCHGCCLGLFGISLADADLLRARLARIAPAVRKDIQRRAERIMRRIRLVTSRSVDRLCDALGAVECPALGRAGQCRLYSHRPLVCRLIGAPVVDRTGRVIHAGGCPKCRLTPAEAPRMDAAGFRREEHRILRSRYGAAASISLTIPQALTLIPSVGRRA